MPSTLLSADGSNPSPSAAGGSGAEKTSSFDASRVLWRSLEFSASKLFITLDAEVHLEPGGPWKDAEPWLVPPKTRRAVADDAADQRVRLETSVLGRRSVESVRFRSRDGQAVQRFKHRLGGRGYTKTQRFLEGGVFLDRLSAASDAEADPSQWTRRSQREFTLPEGAGCVQVVDPIQIFFLISASSIEKVGDAFSICAFSKDSFARLRLEAVEQLSRRAEYLENGAPCPGKERPMLWLRLDVEPLGAGAEHRFELMGLERDLKVRFDLQRRLPVEIQGRHAKMGSVSIRLKAAAWAENRSGD